jgi:SNF2 family DNA or RNA helicase
MFFRTFLAFISLTDPSLSLSFSPSLHRNSEQGPHKPPAIRKALIACPAGLIQNWKKEFHKWLGSERISVFVVDGPNVNPKDFIDLRQHTVMICGYERVS